jgi:hypothetical protein
VKNSRALLIVLTIVTLVGISLGTITYFNRALLEHVYVYDCGIVDYKPTTMTPYCADAGAPKVPRARVFTASTCANQLAPMANGNSPT